MGDFFPHELIMSIDVELEHPNWCMYFDGAVNICGNDIGATLVSQYGAQFPLAAQLQFTFTNYTTKYEACIMGLRALDMNVKDFDV